MKKLFTLLLSVVWATTSLNAATITSFAPTSGPVGTEVTITGTGFNPTAASNVVFFGATQAAVTAASSTSLTVTVPIGATYQSITVTDITTGLTAYSSQPFNATFTEGGFFATKVDFTAGIQPYSVAICDLDGDGKPDMAVANMNSATVSVFRNTGSIGSPVFNTKVDFTTGTNSQPRSVAIGDLDGDGKPDLAVANYNSGAVSVFRNTATSGSITSASFAVGVEFSMANNPSSVAIGDLDGDGKPDLVVTNQGSNSISVRRNTATSGSITSASFAGRVDFATGNFPRSIAISDLDGDGKPDLAVANSSSNTVSVLRNIATSGSITNASFAAKVDFTTGTEPYSVAIGDIDGDGKPELATANYGSNTVSIFANTTTSGSISSASFAAKVDFATRTQPSNVAIGDLDGDGKQDMGIAHMSSGVSVFRNTSISGSITSSSFATKADFDIGASYSVAIGDLDGDGKPDLASPNWGSMTISVFRNVARPPSITSFAPTSGPVSAEVTITGIGFNSTVANNVVFFGATQASVTAATSTSLTITVPVGANYQYISVTDITTGLTAYSTQPFNVTFTEGGNFATKVDFATGSQPQNVAVGDLDGDGKPDLTVTNLSSNTVSVFRNTGSIGNPVFDAKVDFETGTSPKRVVICDLDGDGKPDLAVANSGSNTVSVFRNTATSGSFTSSSFAAKVDFSTGTTLYDFSIGDLDRDGKPDLVVTAFYRVSVLRNTSSSGSITSASFAAKVDFTSGPYPSSIAIGDLDEDDMPDLAVINSSSNTISVFRNVGFRNGISTSSFDSRVDFTTGTQPYSVAIGDIDGDGKPDMAVANASSNAVSVFRNTASNGSITSASFAAKVDFATGTQPFDVAIGDLNGDGKPDLTTANYGSNTLSVLANTSTSGSINSASFAAKLDLATGTAPRIMSICDLDGDGKPDMATANSNSGNISVIRNIPPPPSITSFTPASGPVGTTVTITGVGFNATAANNVVFFGATRATVTVASYSSLTVTVPVGATWQYITVTDIAQGLTAYSPQPFDVTFAEGGYFDAKVDFATGTNPYGVAIGDLDGDGKADLAVANGASSTVSVFRNTGTSGSPSFDTKVDFATGNSPNSVAIGDLDGDGKPDLAVTNYSSSSVSVFRNTATSGSITSSSFAAKVDFSAGSYSGPMGIAIGDLNGDGKADMAVANFSSYKVSVLANISTSGTINVYSFAGYVEFTTGLQPQSVAIGDLDGDGRPDLAVANSGSSTVSVLRNASAVGSFTSASFAAKVDFSTGGAPHSIAIGDLDGDGKPDLATANYAHSTVSVIRNTATSGSITSSSFVPKVDFATGTYPQSLAIGDLDGDGKPDLATANYNSNNVSVIANTSTNGSITSSSFAPKVDFSTGINSRPYSVAIGDLDGDGKADLAVANGNSNTLSVFRNIAMPYIISSFTPASGPVGTQVTITGIGFNTTPANNVVFFGATQATVTAASSTSLTVTVPVGATYQYISVTDIIRGLTAYSSKPFNVTFTGSITFTGKVDFTAGTNPQTVAVGDLDGDSLPDLAVVNRTSNTVSVLRNTGISGSPAFDTKVDFTTGSSPYSVAIGDLDGDGKPDLTVANMSSNTVSVYRNTAVSGSITTLSFAAKVDFSTGTQPQSVAIGDLDGDAKPDLAVVNGSSNTVSVYRNTATSGSITTSSFSAKVDFTTGTGTYPSSIAIGDLDGDGKPDLAVANMSSNTVSVYRNTVVSGSITTSSFAAKVDFTTGTQPYSVAIGDLDGDGKADLATANYGSDKVSVLRNTAAGGSITTSSFAAKIDFTTGTQPRSVSIGDLDGDGKPDLATANYGSNNVSVFRNTATSGSITASSFAAKADFTTGTQPMSVAIGDLDGDGKPDLAAANYGSNSVSVIRNIGPPPVITSFAPASGPVGTTVTITGTGFNTTAANNVVFFGATRATVTAASSTSLSVTVPVGANYQYISVTDITRGLTAYSSKPFIVSFTVGGNFATKVDFTAGSSPYSVATGDLDGDGKSDLAIVNAGSNTVSVFRNTGSSGSPSFDTKVDFTTGTLPYSVAIGDLDGDGKPELAVANYTSNSVSVFRNTATSGSITTSSFAAKVDLINLSGAGSVAIGDLDGDGKPELAVTSSSSAYVYVLRNTASVGSITTSSFDAKVSFTTGSTSQSVAIGDLDGDGKPDLAVASQSSNSVSVLHNTATSGNIAFSAKVDFTTGSQPRSVAIGDLDGDGKPDLAVANSGSATMSVLRNTATSGSITTSSFAAKVDFTTGSQPYSVAIGDLDGDGKPDLAVANMLSYTASVFRNTATSGSITSSSFASKADFTTGTQPYSVAIGDLDGDGKADLATANYGANAVSVLRNIAPPLVIALFAPVSGPVGTTVTITGTGFNTTASNNVVFFGATRATVTAATSTSLTVTVPVGATYQYISVTDITRGVTAYSSSPFNVTFTEGGNFATKVDFAAESASYSLATGDLDGDGKADMAVASFNSNTVSVFRNTGSSGSPSFDTKVDFATGTNAYSVAIGDLDGDGKPDLAVANYSSNTVSVFRNTATIGSITTSSFSAKVDFTTGTTPQSVAIGDLDGDGKPDLAVANMGSGTVSVFRNTGSSGSITTSSFSTKVDFATGTNPSSVAIGDLDGDGKPDLAVTISSSDNVSVLRNTAVSGSITTSSFSAKVDFATGSGPRSVAIGDLDGDGKADLSVANYISDNVSVLRNTASSGSITTSSFATKVDFTTGSNPFNVAIGDLDGNGKPELAVTNNASATISVFLNAATSGSITTSSFAAKVDFTTGTNPRSVAIGDLDGDGKTDMAIANFGSNTVSVIRNISPPPTITSFTPISGKMGATVTITGTGFSATTASNVVFFGATKATVPSASPTSLTATVPSGATYQYISVTNINSGLTAYSSTPFNITSDGGGGFSEKVDFSTGIGSSPFSVATGDLDDDGKPDLAVVNYGSSTVSVFRNTGSSGSPTFDTKVDFTTGSSPYNVAIGDLDGDGKPDLAVANMSSNTVSVFRNTAASGSITTSSFAAKVDFTTGTQPQGVAIGDLNGDGRPDLAVANYASHTLSVFRNTGSSGSITTSSFSAKVDFSTGANSYPDCVTIGDLDGDSKPDLITGNVGSSSISVFRNTASSGSITSSSFAAKVDFGAENPMSIVIGDLDGDDKPDLAIANNSSNTVSVYRNTAISGSITSSSFATKVDFTTGLSPYNVAIGDLDGDGKPDLAVNTYTLNAVSVFRNTAASGSITTSSFAAKVDFPTGSNPSSVVIGDLDGDGKLDLTTTNFGSNTVSVLLNSLVAPSDLSYTTPNIFVKGIAITALSPTVTGIVTGYSVSPSLPAGLSLHSTTGVISGTPTAVTASATYTVTASNSSGSTTFDISITVNDVAPSALSYTTPNVYTKGTAIASLSPTVTGTVVSYSVSPALPDGLSLDTTTGVISGTPTAITTLATYTVTATNTGGSTTKAISITVNDMAPGGLSYTTPNTFTKGTAITSLSPSVSGGAVVSYSVSPALPDGLILDAVTGVISGTPTAITATDIYTVTATNTGGSTTFDISITVNDVAPESLSYTTSEISAVYGITITNNTPASSGGAVVSYSVTPALPVGLSLNTSTGIISGTPTTILSSVLYTLTATNTGGSTTTSVTIRVAQKTLTITANDKTKVYDGSVFSPFTVTYSGFVTGEDETDLGGTLAFTGTATTATNVGTAYVITPGGLTSSNYAITFANGGLDITTKALTVTAEDKTKVYDGTVFSPFTVSYSGFVTGEDETDLGGTLAFSGTAITATNVGTVYVITPGGLTSSNYAIAFANGSLDITTKALTITANDKTKVYDGTVYSPFIVSYSGFVTSEDETDLGGTLAFTGTATTATNVGTAYVITPGGLTSSNYAITFANGGLDITTKALTVTAEDKTKVYDGTVFSPFTVSYSGFVTGEDETDLGGTLAFSGTATTATNAGTAYVITPGGLISPNYAITFANGSLDITTKALTITANDKTKVYDGSVFSPFTVTYSGFVTGEDETDLGGTLAFSGVATTATNVGTAYVITPSGLTSSNYTITFANGGLDITTKALTITANDKTKVYDGSVFSPFTVTYSGFVTGEDETDLGGTLAFSGTAATATNVGTAYVITPGGLTSLNYAITFANGGLDITTKALTITANDKTKVYDGSVFSPFTVTYSGFVTGEDETDLGGTISFSGTATTATNAGTGYVITPGGLTSTNYAITFANGELDITTKALTITAVDKSKVFDGAVYSPFTVSYSGFITGEDETDLGGTLAFTGTATTATNVGTAYVITPGGLTSPNYAITFANGGLDITTKALTITANDKTKVYDGSVYSPFTVTYSGFVTGEDETDLGGTLAFSGVATTATNVGTAYVITPSGLTSSNYTITFANGGLEITKSNQAITFTALAGKSFGDVPFDLTGTASSGLTVSYISSNTGVATVSGSTVTIIGAGTTIITASQAGNGNYNAATSVSQPLTVANQTQTIVFDELPAKTYSDAPFTVSATGGGSGNPVVFSSSDASVATVSGNIITITGAGSCTIYANQAGNGDYGTAPYVDRTLTVNKASQTVTFNSLSNKTYGDAPFTLGGTASSGLTVTYSSSNTSVATISGNTVTIRGVGSATITARQAGNTNYNGATPVDQTLTVVKADQTISFAALAGKAYGDASFDLTGTASSGLAVTYSSSNEAVATVSGNTVTIVGAGTTTITANQSGNANYNAASPVGQPLTVGKSSQTISFAALAEKTYGDAAFALTASASSGLPVTYSSSNTAVATVSGNTITIVGAGTAILTASQGGDDNYTTATPVDQTLTVNKASQILTLAPLPAGSQPLKEATGPVQLTASSTSGLPVVISLGAGSAATLNASNQLTDIGQSGTIVVNVSQAGNTNYHLASISNTFDLGKPNQSILFAAMSDQIYSPGLTVDLNGSASASSTLPISYSVICGPATLSGAVLSVTGSGIVWIKASQAGDATWNAAPEVTRSLAIHKSSFVIDNFADLEKTYGDAPFALNPSSVSTGLFSYSSSNAAVATVSGNTVTLTGAGTAELTVVQAEDANYASVSTTVILKVLQADQTISFGPLAGKTYGGADFALTGTASSGLPVIYISSNPSVAMISGSTVAILGSGTTTITAMQLGNTNYKAAEPVAQELTVGKKSQAITFDAPASKTYGDGDFNFSATSTSGLAVTYTSSNQAVATVSSSTVTIIGAGTTTITASQGGNENYLAATDVPQTLTVSKAGQVLTLSPLPIGSLALKDITFPVQVSASSSSGLAVTISLGSGSAATLNGSNQLINIQQSGTVTIQLNQAGNANYNAANASYSFDVEKSNQHITFPAITNRVLSAGLTIDLNGMAYANSGLTVNYTLVNGPATLSGTVLTISGAGDIVVTASQAGNSTWNPAADVTQTISIGKAIPEIINFADLYKTYGDAPFSLNASSVSSGAVTYASSNETVATVEGSQVKIKGAGTAVLTAQQAADANYAQATATASLFVEKAEQTISFDALPVKTYGDDAFGLSALSTSGLTISYTSGNEEVATVSGNTVTIIGAGTANIIASQAGNCNYKQATAIMRALTVNKQSQAIAFAALDGKAYGDAPFALTATGGGSGNPVTFTSSDNSVATVSGNTVTIIGAGSCTIYANQAGDDNYTAAPSVGRVLTVGKSGQTLSFETLADKIYGDAAFNPAATSTSALGVSYISSNTAVATVSGNTITITGAGTTSITAIQPGNGNYNPATPVVQNLTVTRSDQTITFATLAGKAFGDAPYGLAGTASSGLVVNYTSSNTGVATVSGSTVTIVGVGTTIITASQSGNSNYNAAASGSQPLTVANQAQSIVFDELGARTFGDSPFTVSAAGGGSGNPVVFSSSDASVAIVSGNIITITGAGSCTIYANQAGNGDYGTAVSVGQTLAVEKAGQTISFESLANKIVKDVDFQLSATASSGLSVTFTSSDGSVAKCSGTNGTTVTIIGAGSCIIYANQSGNANYKAASAVEQKLTVLKYIAGDIDKDGKITYPEIAGDKNGDGDIKYPEIAGDKAGDGDIKDPEIAGDKDGDGDIKYPEIAGDKDGDGDIKDPEIAGDKDGDGDIKYPEIAGDKDGDGDIKDPEIAGDKDGDGDIKYPEIAGDKDGDGDIKDPEIAGDKDGDGDIKYPEITGDKDGDGEIKDPEIAGDKDGDGDIKYPEITGDKDGDGDIKYPEIAGDKDGDGEIKDPEIAGDKDGDGDIKYPEIAGDKDGDGEIKGTEITGDKNGDGDIKYPEIAGDKDGDGDIKYPEIAGDKDGDGDIKDPEIAGDKDGDGDIKYPEITGDKDGDGDIQDPEIAGDKDGDGEIKDTEITGDKDGDGKIDDKEIAGDKDGDGDIKGPEIIGDKNGDGSIDGHEVAGDNNGDGSIGTGETAGNTGGTGSGMAGDANGNGKIDDNEIAGDLNGDGIITLPEMLGDLDGDGHINGNEIAGDTNGNGQIDPTETRVVDPEKDHLNVDHLFSPNGDGVNDYWKLRDIEKFGRVYVKIYDRWGTLLYETTNYQNDWDGTSKGKLLPEGAYVYFINTEKDGTKTGVINIVR